MRSLPSRPTISSLRRWRRDALDRLKRVRTQITFWFVNVLSDTNPQPTDVLTFFSTLIKHVGDAVGVLSPCNTLSTTAITMETWHKKWRIPKNRKVFPSLDSFLKVSASKHGQASATSLQFAFRFYRGLPTKTPSNPFGPSSSTRQEK